MSEQHYFKSIILCVSFLIITQVHLSSQPVVRLDAETTNSRLIFRNNGSDVNNGSQFLLGNYNNGFAAYYLDGANGDFIGSDYSLLKQRDDLSLELVNLGNNPIYIKNGGDNLINTRIGITSSGNVGIGTYNAQAKLQVEDGDVYIEDINSGVIMKSPNGACWRLQVQNSGHITTTAIACP